MRRWLAAILLPLVLLAAPARAQAPAVATPSLVAELSQRRIEVTTAFTGAEILVFGATERLIHADGDEVVVTVRGPIQPMVVRQKTQVLGLWVNGAAARFNGVPGYWALAATRPVTQMVAPETRADLRLGLDHLIRVQLGAQGAQFRAALAELKQAAGLWVSEVRPIEVSGGRLFAARLPLPATVATGDYIVQVLLVREGRVVARQELTLTVQRTGTTAWIADVARQQPVMYGLACIMLAAFAGWLGSVLFRRG